METSMDSAVATSVAHGALLSPVSQVSAISRSLASTPSDTHSQTSCSSEMVSKPPRVSSECVQSKGTAGNLGDVPSCTACTRLSSEQRSAKTSRKTAPTTTSQPRSLSTLTSRELEKSFRALSCHHRKLQQKHVDLMKAHQEKDGEITRLNAKICALESELYLMRLAYSDDFAFDPLQTSLNQYDIRPTRDPTPGREAASSDVGMSTPEPCRTAGPLT
ncbi:uncharacterized protein BO66DRAFT_472911 [Aspergillus aculeatinus CBS 121060]|uniref:Uncharacterized protein n=1 Tax=Aspergillus aculeatinus CBS 121060 TaxID=1448322 RepID=A0ACD1H3N6_9EURO|nr:hypothetical protein BO66DRAFT_472911 [Aspergillus aculeatinus CBS 121060]RAH68046.1 hypothetical protein BO66DRAFT_472911 [Aspergillus aculeatinus CBS 121060]